MIYSIVITFMLVNPLYSNKPPAPGPPETFGVQVFLLLPLFDFRF